MSGWQVSSNAEFVTARSPGGCTVVMSRKSADMRAEKNCQRLLRMIGAEHVWAAMSAEKRKGESSSGSDSPV